MSEEITVIESNVSVSSQEKAALDIQIVTAKNYPRDVTRSINNSIAIATMDLETAKSCGYALPRSGKVITGATIHLAKIVAQNWGNLRVEAKEVETTATQIVCQAICFDLETNYAAKIEVRKSIVTKYGKRYSDDMVTMSSRVASAIAFRNAVFAVVPKPVVAKVYQESMNLITGSLSTEAKLIKSRKTAIEYFVNTHGATEDELFKFLGVGAEAGIKQEQIINLQGLRQALKDGETTVNKAFNREEETKESAIDKKKKNLKEKNAEKVNLP